MTGVPESTGNGQERPSGYVERDLCARQSRSGAWKSRVLGRTYCLADSRNRRHCVCLRRYRSLGGEVWRCLGHSADSWHVLPPSRASRADRMALASCGKHAAGLSRMPRGDPGILVSQRHRLSPWQLASHGARVLHRVSSASHGRDAGTGRQSRPTTDIVVRPHGHFIGRRGDSLSRHS
jgi:hypothetical protein